MKLHNLMEDEVICTVDKMLDDRVDMCTCNKCKLDIAAIALNNLKPKYVVTEKGGLYGKLDILDLQFNADLAREITKAIEIVKNNPHHGQNTVDSIKNTSSL